LAAVLIGDILLHTQPIVAVPMRPIQFITLPISTPHILIITPIMRVAVRMLAAVPLINGMSMNINTALALIGTFMVLSPVALPLLPPVNKECGTLPNSIRLTVVAHT
jgi:hypothetical protein